MYYWFVQDLKSKANSGVGSQPKKTVLAQPQNATSGQTKLNKQLPGNRASATPKKCTQPDGSVFYTNAPRCQDANLNNRISHSDPVKPVPRVALNEIPQSRPKKQSSSYSDQGLILVDQHPSSFKQACKFPIGMAQKIEKKSLRLKDDPKTSVWKDSFCRWVCEADREQCGSMNQYLLNAKMCNKHQYQSLKDCDDVYD